MQQKRMWYMTKVFNQNNFYIYYLIAKPLFIIAARRRFSHGEIKRSQTCGDILAHSSMHISFNSARFFRLLFRIFFFSVPLRFSIGLGPRIGLATGEH